MKKYIYSFLCLSILTTGCIRKKEANKPHKSFFSKANKKKVKKRVSSFDENLEAFALDNDTLKDFAHEHHSRSQRTHQNTSNNGKTSQNVTTKKASSLFRWEDITSDESKEQFKTLYFHFNKYGLAKDQIKNLKSDIDYAKKMIALGKTIVIEGHACHSEGSAIYNMTLSEKRAKFVAQKFIDAGVNKTNIKIAARGQEMPIVHGGDRKAQSVNRRVEIFAIDN